jgi:hypothetical protein
VLYYDLDLNAWVRKPGSASPPWMEPVVTLGANAEVSIQFCRGAVPVVISSSETWLAGLKIAGDSSGDYVASSDEAVNRTGQGTSFNLDLTTAEAAAYFTANPTAAIVACEFQVEFTVDGVKTVTTRLPVTLQNSILTAP